MPNALVPAAETGLPIETVAAPSAGSSEVIDRHAWSHALTAMRDLERRFDLVFDSKTPPQVAAALFERLDMAQKALIALPAQSVEDMKHKLALFRDIVWGYDKENVNDADYSLFVELEADIVKFISCGASTACCRSGSK